MSAGRVLSVVGFSLAVLLLAGCSGEAIPQASPSASAGLGDTLELRAAGLSLAVTLLEVELIPAEAPEQASPGSSFLGVRLAIGNTGSAPYEAKLGDCVSMVGPGSGGYQAYSPVQGDDPTVDGTPLPNAVGRLLVPAGGSQTVWLWFPGWERSNYRFLEFAPTGDWGDAVGDWRLDL